MLALRDISLAYDNRPLLERISLQVDSGEILGLLGTSGSGKTSLLRIIAGLDLPDSGQVTWDGVSLDGIPTEKRNFGLVFQDYGLFPHLDIAGNIGFGLRMQRATNRIVADRVEEILNLIGMPGWGGKRVETLSGGEQQRVALGRALAVRPRLLMLDEPLNALDAVLRSELALEIRRILTLSRIPAIYVTHDQEEAFAIATRIAVLHQGRILQDDTPRTILRVPTHEWIAEFLGLGVSMEGIYRKKKNEWADTEWGRLAVAPTAIHVTDGARVMLLVRACDGDWKTSPQKAKGWRSGRVVRIIPNATETRVFVQLDNGLQVRYIGAESWEVGKELWWKPKHASLIRVK
jgi:ABC-type Fe3+/spermidine/putrescine transport system ATPase subunit